MQNEVTTLVELEAAVVREAGNAQLAGRRIFLLGAVFAIGLIAYMGWMYSNLGVVMDEKELAVFVRDYTEVELLPQAKPALRDFLLEQVPQGVNTLSQTAISQLPQFRTKIVSSFGLPLDNALADLEFEMNTIIDRELSQNQGRVRRVMDMLPEEHKRQYLAEELAAMFRTYYTLRAQDFVQQFERQLSAVDDELRVVLTAPPSSLSPSQREKRQLLLLGLASLENAFAGDGGGVVESLLITVYEKIDQ